MSLDFFDDGTRIMHAFAKSGAKTGIANVQKQKIAEASAGQIILVTFMYVHKRAAIRI